MLAPGGFGWDDSWVSRLKWLWVHESVLVSGNKLSFVVCASITDHDLRRILIWHNDCWLWQSASKGIRVVWLQWLFDHTGVKVFSHFVLVLRKGGNFGKSLAGKVYWLWSSIVEWNTNGLSIFLQDLAAGRNLSIFEHGGRVGIFFSKDLCLFIVNLLAHSLFHFLESGTFLELFLWDSHFKVDFLEFNNYKGIN